MRAVGMLRLAGCSSGWRDCARGGRSARRGGSRAGLCSFYAGRAFLLGCLVLVRAHHTFLPKCFMLDHACCLPPVRQTGRLAGCFVPVPPWVGIAIRAFSNRRCGYPAFLVHFGLARFLWRRSRRRTKETRRTESAARLLCAFAQSHRPCNSFRGEYVGAARPKPAPKSLRLSGLSSRCGGAVLVQIPIPAKNASTQIAAPTLAKPGYTERPARL